MDELCRLCSSKNKLINIFRTRVSGNMRYVIKVASGVEILETDEISHNVCLKCWTLSTSIYQFRQRSSKNNQELIDAHNKRKQRELSRIRSHQNDNTDSNNTNCNLENEMKSINLHPSIIQIKKQHPNLKLPPLEPDSNFQPFITLSTNEVNVWYQNQNPTEDAIFQVGDKCVEKLNTLISVGCNSLQNIDVDFNQAETISSKEIKQIQNNGIQCLNNEHMECQTVEKRASIGQTQNKEEDVKRKLSNESDKNSEIVSFKKMKSISKENYDDTSQKATGKNRLAALQKNELRPASSKKRSTESIRLAQCSSPKKARVSEEAGQLSSTKLHIDQKSEEILRKQCEAIPARVVLRKLTIGSEHNNLTHSFPKQCSSTRKKVLSYEDDSNVSCSKFKLTKSYDSSLESLKQHENQYHTSCTFCSHQLESIEDRKQHMLFHCPKRTIRMPKVVLTKIDIHKEIVSINSEQNESTSRITADTERVLFSKHESNISCSKSKLTKEKDRQMETGKNIESKKSVVAISPSKEKNQQKLTVGTEQNKAIPVEITDEELSKGIHLSAFRHVLKGKLMGISTSENVQDVHFKDSQETVVVEVQKNQTSKAEHLVINTVNALSSFSNDDDNIDKVNHVPNNSLKIDFVKSLNLMPCFKNTEYEAYTENELLSVRFVKFCCKYCNSYHNTLRSLKQHEKKYHTSCAFCSQHLESIEERKKHMLFYCSKRTIRMPKVVLTKVDKQKEIASKYAKSFFSISSGHNESTSRITPNTKEQIKVQTDICMNLQDSETRKECVTVDSLCDLSAHTPLFKIANYNDVSMISSKKPNTLDEIYHKIKHRTLYTSDPPIVNTVDGEYCLKDFGSEVCLQRITVDVKYGDSIRFQYAKDGNLSDLNIQQNFWNNETVTYPPMRTINSQPETRQVVPGQIIDMHSTDSRNK